jgi:hypothetical protein
MAGKIIADQIEGTTTTETVGGASVTIPNVIDTKYVVNGGAKAFATIDGTGTIALLKSLNMSSLTDVDTGQYDTNFITSFSDIVYTPHGNAKENTSSSRNADVDRAFQSARRPHTTSTCEWFAMTFAGADSDVEEAYALIHGDLA